MKTTYIISRKKTDRTMAEKYRAERQKKRAFMVLSAGLVLVILIMCTFQLVQYKAYATEPKREYVTELPISYEAVTVQSKPEKVSLGTYYVTGYVGGCAHCCGNENNITASGTPCVAGITCAAGSEFDFGTVLEIDGLGMFIVEDRGVGNGHIDIACATHEECYEITGEYEVFVG